jgi:decaprenylphospho-beta-D-ribofuranose 2-oxidase
MPQAELTLEGAAAAPEPVPAVVRGWGGGDGCAVSLLSPPDAGALAAAVDRLRRSGQSAIARGMGRAYGDAAQLSGGTVLDTSRLSRFALGRDRGTVTAQAGVTLGELLRELVPAGWMVPVLPGTQHVTVGGAIASDIHGKNHGTAGTLGSHVEAIGLLSAAGEVLELTPDSELFAATLGGMGLTGLIVWARLQLTRIPGPLLAVDTDRVNSVEEALAALAAPGGPYRVAWLDLLAGGAPRGFVTRAAHAEHPAKHGRATMTARATIPERWPGGILRPATVRAFNELRFRTVPRTERGRIEGIGRHMFPLDALDAWPRLYGRRGFLQYQLVVPAGAVQILDAVIDELRRARVPCYLAVLKDFGPANAAPLSFPIAGWTLALDLPRGVPGLEAALSRCDVLVAEASGRVYLTKDSRLRPDAVEAMYPRVNEWRAVRDRIDPDGLWRSDLGVRTGLLST